jgi:peptidyl-Lys metalloendopeptidase
VGEIKVKQFGKGFAALLTALLLAISVTAGASDIAVDISVDESWLDASEDVFVHVSFTNLGTKPAKLLKWYTAADGIDENLFKVSRDGAALPYLGAHYKRPPPVIGDYLVLKAGETVTQVAELSGAYDFSKSGDYSVQFRVASLTLFDPAAAHRNDPGAAKVESLESNEVSLWVQGRATDGSDASAAIRGKSDKNGGNRGGGKPGGDPPTVGRLTFTGGCTNTQQQGIIDAVAAAEVISQDAVAYLGKGQQQQGSRYTTWFGTVTSSRYNTVKDNFSAIYAAMSTEDITVDCKCKQNYYAYVYPNDPYKIYVCKVFWQAPLLGTDSKAGTLVHEMSHFRVVADTDDVVYGQTGARNLASSNPDAAITNADSHEYFAENTPFQN